MKRSRRRAHLALAACVLWLAGFEILPWAHVAFHDEVAPHIHVGDTIVTVSFDGPTHRHSDGSVHRGDDSLVSAPHHRPDGRTRWVATGHGDHSLAHHGVAAIPTTPPPHHPLPVDRVVTAVVTLTTQTFVSSPVPTAAARGPPRARHA